MKCSVDVGDQPFWLSRRWSPSERAGYAGLRRGLSARLAVRIQLRRRELRTVLETVAVLTLLMFSSAFPTVARSNDFGPGFSGAFQFRNANDRAARSGVVDLMERKKAGFYEAPIYNISNTTNIAGDQIVCDITATSIGNTGSNLTEGQSGAPSVKNAPDVSSDAVGNAAGGEAGGPLNAGGSGGTNTVNTSQELEESTQTSSVGRTTQGGVTGDVGGSESALSQRAINDQSIQGSPLNSDISNSRACNWD